MVRADVCGDVRILLEPPTDVATPLMDPPPTGELFSLLSTDVDMLVDSFDDTIDTLLDKDFNEGFKPETGRDFSDEFETEGGNDFIEGMETDGERDFKGELETEGGRDFSNGLETEGERDFKGGLETVAGSGGNDPVPLMTLFCRFSNLVFSLFSPLKQNIDINN